MQGILKLTTPIKVRGKDVNEIPYDFNAADATQYIKTMDKYSDGEVYENRAYIGSEQALVIFCAAGQVEGADARDLMRMSASDAMEAEMIAREMYVGIVVSAVKKQKEEASMKLRTPLCIGEETQGDTLEEIVCDFSGITSAQYVKAMDRYTDGKVHRSPLFISSAQAFALFCAGAKVQGAARAALLRMKMPDAIEAEVRGRIFFQEAVLSRLMQRLSGAKS